MVGQVGREKKEVAALSCVVWERQRFCYPLEDEQYMQHHLYFFLKNMMTAIAPRHNGISNPGILGVVPAVSPVVTFSPSADGGASPLELQ